ncbi:cytosine permease [Terrilactibacillus sp. S3-3]|nr:cytosine permease [Terrilactibacillus sp. S3-3]
MLPAIVNSIVLIGWSWIQAYMAGLSLNYAISHMTGYSNIDLFTILTEAAVVLITIYGHRGVERIEKYVSIAMLILSVLVFYKLFSTYNINHLVTLKLTKHPSTTFPVAFDIVVATAFSWMSSVCDFNRHCQGKKGGFIGTYLGYIVASVIAMGLGATVSFSLMTGVEKTYDPTVLLSHYGFGLIAAIVIFLSVLSTNVMALYSATMSFMNVVPRMAFWKPALMMGIICTIGALLKEFLMNNFYNFILLIGTMFIPVFAIVIVDHYLLKHGRYHAEEIVSNTIGHYVYKHGINYVAYIAYLLGAAFAYYFTYIQPLPTGATLLTFIFSGGLYWGLMALFGQLKVGVVDSQAGYDEQIHA